MPFLSTRRRISMGGVATCLHKSSPLTTVICSKTSQVSVPPLAAVSFSNEMRGLNSFTDR